MVHLSPKSPVSLLVAEASLPSTMFCFPERAAWTIWSMVRSPRERNRCVKITVPW